MTRRACLENQQMALKALSGEIKEGKAMERMLVCGMCDRSGFDRGKVKEVFRSSISNLIDEILEYDEWGPDPEVSAVKLKNTRREYREANRETLLENDRMRRMGRRIHQLKEASNGHT